MRGSGVGAARNAGELPARDVTFREARAEDAGGIAALHADSWRRHYRGAYLDSYLDGDVLPERLQVWTSRLAGSSGSVQYTAVAEDEAGIAGFAHVMFDHAPTWGALLDNLHVRSDVKRGGIGTNLMSRAALGLLRHRPSGSMHLWVLDQNQAAQSFYDARGGTRVESQLRGPFPGGGTALGHRYFWPDASLLVEPER